MKILPTLIALPLFFANLSAEVNWEKNEAKLGEQARGIDAADFDGDGQLDIVATGTMNVFTVLNPIRNKQAQPIYNVVDGKLLYGTSGDMDKDGDLDFVIARETSPWIEYREKRAKREKVKKPKRVPDFSIAWIENTGRIEKRAKIHVVDKDLNGSHGLVIADMNADGNLDVVGNSISGIWKNSIAWYDNFGGKFVRQLITQRNAPDRPHYMDTADMNGDKKMDLLVGHSGGNKLSWYQNPPAMNGRWESHIIAELKGVTNVHAVDIDGDNRLDVVASAGHGTGVYWYRSGNWKQNPIDETLIDGHALAVGDFDMDGDIDVAAASFTQKVVRWYENDGKGNFKPHDLDSGSGQEAYDLKAVDLNKDGRLDLLLAGRDSNNAVWYINRQG